MSTDNCSAQNDANCNSDSERDFVDTLSNDQIPWVSAAIGSLLGISLVVSDFVAHRSKGYFPNPLVQIAVIFLVASIFFFVAHASRNWLRLRKRRQSKPIKRSSSKKKKRH